MDTGLWYMLLFCIFVAIAFLVFLILSSCMGPQIIRACRSVLAQHYRSSRRGEWDEGGAGYREVGRKRGFMEGMGGAEGYEMASLGDD